MDTSTIDFSFFLFLQGSPSLCHHVLNRVYSQACKQCNHILDSKIRCSTVDTSSALHPRRCVWMGVCVCKKQLCKQACPIPRMAVKRGRSVRARALIPLYCKKMRLEVLSGTKSRCNQVHTNKHLGPSVKWYFSATTHKGSRSTQCIRSTYRKVLFTPLSKFCRISHRRAENTKGSIDVAHAIAKQKAIFSSIGACLLAFFFFFFFLFVLDHWHVDTPLGRPREIHVRSELTGQGLHICNI